MLLSDPNLGAMRLPDLLDGGSSVTNLTLACGDGSLASHKILVAGVSSFIKNILADIPIGDDVTLILPDFTVAEVDTFLKSVTLKEETNNFDLSVALGRHVNIPITVRAKEEDMWVPVVEKMKVEFEEEEEKDFLPGSPSDSRRMTGLENWKEDLSNIYDPPSTSDRKIEDRRHKNNAVDFAARAEELNIDVEKNIRELEEEISRTPFREKKIRKQIKFQKAVGDLISGQYSFTQAASKWGVPRSTLQRLFHAGGKNYSGKGYKSKVFTKEEEDRIREKALELSDGGKNLTKKMLINVMKEEFSILQVNYPDRHMTDKQWHGFAYIFAGRHNLTEVIKAAKLKKKESHQHECDLCGLKYSFQNSLMTHKRNVHFL